MVENLAAYFADLGVSCVVGTATGMALFDRGTQSILGGNALSEEESITLASTTFPSLVSGDALTVNATSYTAREVEYLDDGKLKRITLRRA